MTSSDNDLKTGGPVRLALHLMLLALPAAGIASTAFAQGPWSVFAGGGAAGFGGASSAGSSIDGDPVQFKPSPTTRLHVGVATAFGRGGITLDASYSKSSLGVYGTGASYSIDPAITLWDVRLLASYELSRLGESSSLRIALGPMVQFWSGDAIIDAKTSLGGAVALTLVVPMTRSLGLLVSGSMGVAGSPFAGETLSDFGTAVPTSTWTRELGVGVRVAL